MKIAIIGAGNMGSAIARGLVEAGNILPEDITVINRSAKNRETLQSIHPNICIAISVYDSLALADVVIVCVKPWLVEELLHTHCNKLSNPKQLLLSVAGGITLDQLAACMPPSKPLYRVMPNTAIALRQSMTFVASMNATQEQDESVLQLFAQLGKVEFIAESLFAAATSLASCGIAFALRYIRAAMEGGVEMGFYPNEALTTVIQTLRGAIELLEANNSHPETEIDKVTTAGGITIKGLNAMEHAGFTSSVINGLITSKID